MGSEVEGQGDSQAMMRSTEEERTELSCQPSRVVGNVRVE